MTTVLVGMTPLPEEIYGLEHTEVDDVIEGEADVTARVRGRARRLRGHGNGSTASTG